MPINAERLHLAETSVAGPGRWVSAVTFGKELTMRNHFGKAALILMLGTPLMLGGCATQEAVEHAQSSADAAMAAAEHAQSTAEAAAQKADAANQKASGAAADAQRANERLDQLDKAKGERG